MKTDRITLIEKGTKYDELTKEQYELLDDIQSMIAEMKDVVAIMNETIEYNDPTLGGFVPSQPAGFCYTITADMDKFRMLKKQIDNLCSDYLRSGYGYLWSGYSNTLNH
jgi:hypothetical protein